MAQQRPHGTRRVWLPAAAFGLFAAAIGVRLVQLQVLEHDYYAAKAREELLGNDTIYAQRGTILDRNGGVLATSVTTWDIYVNVRVWKDDAAANKAAAELAPFLKTTPTALRSLVSSAESLDARVYHDLSYEAGIELIKRKVPGVIALSNTARINPEGDVASSVLGFIGTENTGLAGIEAAYNEVLQGQPGRAIYERDTTGDPIPYGQHTVTQPKPGEDLVLTIDRVLQEMAEQYLADGMKEHRAKGGSIIVMDPMTGEILALATSPGLKFSSLEEDLSGGGDDALSLLRNRAVTDLYEPGSVMKIITAAAAIDAGVVGPNTEYVDTGIVYIENVPLKNWDDGSYGKQTMTGVLQNSINSGAVFMQQALGTKRFQQYLDAFGFGKPTGVDLQGEASGIFRRPEDDGYSPVDVATQSFGQSISVTPDANDAGSRRGHKRRQPDRAARRQGADRRRTGLASTSHRRWSAGPFRPRRATPSARCSELSSARTRTAGDAIPRATLRAGSRGRPTSRCGERLRRDTDRLVHRVCPAGEPEDPGPGETRRKRRREDWYRGGRADLRKVHR